MGLAAIFVAGGAFVAVSYHPAFKGARNIGNVIFYFGLLCMAAGAAAGVLWVAVVARGRVVKSGLLKPAEQIKRGHG
jgi:hypothetical protein